MRVTKRFLTFADIVYDFYLTFYKDVIYLLFKITDGTIHSKAMDTKEVMKKVICNVIIRYF